MAVVKNFLSQNYASSRMTKFRIVTCQRQEGFYGIKSFFTPHPLVVRAKVTKFDRIELTQMKNFRDPL